MASQSNREIQPKDGPVQENQTPVIEATLIVDSELDKELLESSKVSEEKELEDKRDTDPAKEQVKPVQKPPTIQQNRPSQ